MMTASEEMPELVGEQNDQKSRGEGKAREERGGILVEECKGADKFIEGSGLVIGVGESKLCTGSQAGAKGEEKESHGENE